MIKTINRPDKEIAIEALVKIAKTADNNMKAGEKILKMKTIAVNALEVFMR